MDKRSIKRAANNTEQPPSAPHSISEPEPLRNKSRMGYNLTSRKKLISRSAADRNRHNGLRLIGRF